MPLHSRRSRLRARPVLALAALAAIAGALTASAEGAAPVVVSAAPSGASAAKAPPAVPLVSVLCAPQPSASGSGSGSGSGSSAAAGKPPSKGLLDAFGVLRRERTPTDELPKEALDALRAQGLEPVAPEAARLLRTTPAGGRAWVVPVPDVDACASLRPALVRLRPGRRAPLRPTPARRAPREGLAVVAIGDAPVGGGGALSDLVRGRGLVPQTPAPVPTARCWASRGLCPTASRRRS